MKQWYQRRVRGVPSEYYVMTDQACDNFTPQAFKKTFCQVCFLPQTVHAGQSEAALSQGLWKKFFLPPLAVIRAGSTLNKKSIFEEKIKEQNSGPAVVKKTTWEKTPGGGESFQKKTKSVVNVPPPAKKSISDLP
eukprot:TRINITY_DN5936_c0_g1_i10.p2 TRINITY_DN5936_c0_g1~~TRINITY_DN5936_c0_g1_i10.p2  ORF type:complete len:135 (+),score=31.89 TRINITY_DN5936_c0_g1_i10:32-436(+)